MLHFLFSFRGRVSRKQYWYFTILMNLPYILYLIDPQIVQNIMDAAFAWGEKELGEQNATYGVFALLFLLFWISLAFTIKRFHDRGKSGWWVFIAFVPVIGAIWMVIELYFFPSQQGANAYGYAST